MKTTARAKAKQPAQSSLPFRSWGGARKGAGRRPGKGRRNHPHRARARFAKGKPSHVTLRVVDAIADLRRWRVYAAFIELLAKSHRGNFRVLEFSIEHGHLHLIVEAFDWRALTNGVRALEIRLARRVNALTGRTGRAIADRFHARALGSPREVRNAYVYVLGNAAKHARAMGADVDLLSSAPWFRGWSDARAAARARSILEKKLEDLKLKIPDSAPVARAETWLAGSGWRRRGLIGIHERPRSGGGTRAVE